MLLCCFIYYIKNQNKKSWSKPRAEGRPDSLHTSKVLRKALLASPPLNQNTAHLTPLLVQRHPPHLITEDQICAPHKRIAHYKATLTFLSIIAIQVLSSG